ncbi:hypothetical protein ACIQ1J_34110 [Streptomyces sp. NPDC097107]|uniref:hypothetical protein n=1 Tax=Streptomyces sp. NPDC097107 TaxID=3366089 RepID=UPI0038084F9E
MATTRVRAEGDQEPVIALVGTGARPTAMALAAAQVRALPLVERVHQPSAPLPVDGGADTQPHRTDRVQAAQPPGHEVVE